MKLSQAVSPGIAAASLCINRRLATIALSRKAISGVRRERLNILVELSIGVGVPVLIMILSYIPQGHRFDLIEGYGCATTYVQAWPTILLLQIPPVLLSLISAAYGGESVHDN